MAFKFTLNHACPLSFRLIHLILILASANPVEARFPVYWLTKASRTDARHPFSSTGRDSQFIKFSKTNVSISRIELCCNLHVRTVYTRRYTLWCSSMRLVFYMEELCIHCKLNNSIKASKRCKFNF